MVKFKLLFVAVIAVVMGLISCEKGVNDVAQVIKFSEMTDDYVLSLKGKVDETKINAYGNEILSIMQKGEEVDLSVLGNPNTDLELNVAYYVAQKVDVNNPLFKSVKSSVYYKKKADYWIWTRWYTKTYTCPTPIDYEGITTYAFGFTPANQCN